MDTATSYKYINLLLKVIIGVAALYFIYYKLKGELLVNLQGFGSTSINWYLLSIVFVLMFLNWGIESFKWKYSIRNTQQISFFKSYAITFSAVTTSLLTPNRIGEVPVRALLLSRKNFKELVSKTIVSSFSQLIITVLFGTVGFIVVSFSFNLILNSLIVLISSLLVLVLALLAYYNSDKIRTILYLIPFFKRKKIAEYLSGFTHQELTNLLMMSTFRYLVFALQFYLVLGAFGVHLVGLEQWSLITVCFLFASIVPTLLISEIGVRGSVALLVFGVVSDQDLMILLSSVMLWFINVGVPAIIGLFNFGQLKLIGRQ